MANYESDQGVVAGWILHTFCGYGSQNVAVLYMYRLRCSNKQYKKGLINYEQ